MKVPRVPDGIITAIISIAYGIVLGRLGHYPWTVAFWLLLVLFVLIYIWGLRCNRTRKVTARQCTALQGEKCCVRPLGHEGIHIDHWGGVWTQENTPKDSKQS